MNPHTDPIPLSKAHAGMVLALDLCDAGGAVLLPAGTALSEASLASLGRRGIDAVSVVSEAPAPTSAEQQAERLRQCARLERLFRRSAAVEATGQLLGYLLHYRQEGPHADGH